LSQPSSPQNPSSSSADPTPRRLISPAERFAPPVEPEPEHEAPAYDPFLPEPHTVSRRDEEMARRHLPPRERRKHERLVRKREKHESRRRVVPEAPRHDPRHSDPRLSDPRHEQRAQAEREFALNARTEPPKAAIKPRRRVPVWLKRLFILVAILFVGQLGFAALTAPQFNIQTVSISRVQDTPQLQLYALAEKLRGQNLIRVNRAATEKAVEKLPTVASAHVVRLLAWPPKVELRVEERQPILIVGAGNDWWVADAQGVVFRRAAAKDAALYQVVAPEFSPPQGLKPGSRLEAITWARAVALNGAIRSDNRVVAASETGDAVAGDNAYWQLRRIYFDKDGLASLRLTGRGQLKGHDEMLLRLGDDHWHEKLARARVALSYFEKTGRRAEELDLVSLERPVWLPIPAQLAVEGEAEGSANGTG
jgi:hypothetical protein